MEWEWEGGNAIIVHASLQGQQEIEIDILNEELDKKA